jgi:large subunit ribosomal protein L17e
MTRYAVKPESATKTVKASGAYLRVHFKNTRETAHALRGLTLAKAKAYLQAVKDHKRCVPFTRFHGGVGRTGQAKEFGWTMGRWPIKSVELVESLIENAAANAEAKGLDQSKLYVSHIQVNRAPKQRRRTYRAHGRINPYQSSPSHVELIMTEKPEDVPKAAEDKVAAKALTRRRAAVQRTAARHARK